MKVLLFITGHRQLKEYDYFAFFLNRLKQLNEVCDLYIHCNKEDISSDIHTYFQKFNIPKKELCITGKNVGYMMGHLEALSDAYDNGMLNDYDYVIHTHPDVFLTDDTYLMDVLNKNYDNDTVFFITKSIPSEPRFFSTDFFIFKPKLLTQNIWKDELYTNNIGPEVYLHNMIHKYNVKYTFIDRFTDGNCGPRRISEYLRDWHEHDLGKVEQYIRSLN